MSDDFINLIIWLGAGVTALASALLIWALAWDRLRRFRNPKIKRCPNCWYTMEHLEGIVCPECGFEVRKERNFYKTRRRWRWACLAIILLSIGSTGLSFGRLVLIDWIPKTPSWALLMTVEQIKLPSSWPPRIPPTFAGRVSTELWDRYHTGDLSLNARKKFTRLQFTSPNTPLTIRNATPITEPTKWWLDLSGEIGGPLPRSIIIQPIIPGIPEILLYDIGSSSWIRPVHEIHQFDRPPNLTKITPIQCEIRILEGDQEIFRCTTTVQ